MSLTIRVILFIIAHVTQIKLKYLHSIFVLFYLPAPIRIIKRPRPQTIMERETLKLDCEASGPPSICYQWLKNGEKLSGETIPTFVTQSVKLAHFGYYSCCVGSIETKAAFVDVQPEQGTRKCHQEDFSSQISTK